MTSRTTWILLWAAVSAAPLASQITTVQLAPDADASIYSESDRANGTGATLFTGRTASGNLRRSLLRFDLSPVPAGATIVSVEVDITPTFSQANNQSHALHCVTESWGEGPTSGGGTGGFPQAGDVSWPLREHPSTPWSQPGGTHVATPSASAALANSGTQTIASTVELVADVQAWIDTPSSNNGWLLRGNETTPRTAYRIASRESANAPSLRVEYSMAGANASVTPIGTGCNGQILTTFGGAPTLGNVSFGLEVQSVPGAIESAAVLFALAPLSTPVTVFGCPIWIDLGTTVVSVPLDAQLRLPLPVPGTPETVGLTFSVQNLGIDPAGPALLSSNGLTLVVGS